MTTMNCRCRIKVDVIRLNEREQPTWNYLLETFVNVCGRCAHKQMKFQQMEIIIMNLEKQRMDMFLNENLAEPEPEINPEDRVAKFQPETATGHQ